MSIFPRTIIDLALISLLICFTNQVTEYNSQSESLSPSKASIINIESGN